MRLVVTGAGVLSPAGIGLERLAAEISDGHGWSSRVNAGNLFAEQLPDANFNLIPDFDACQLLGRKGTAGLDRQSALAVVACGQALQDSGLSIDDDNRDRIGVAFGTTWGSLKSTSDFVKESLLADRPYLVSPIHFPNTVLNCAAGQAAIRYGLRGINATLAGGRLAFWNALEYTANVLRCGRAEAMLVGSAEEITPHTAWAIDATEQAKPSVIGEAAGSFVIESFDAASIADRHIDIEILSVCTGFCPESQNTERLSAALAGCTRRALTNAKVAAGDVTCIATCESPDGEGPVLNTESRAIASVFGETGAERIGIRAVFGECLAATGALQLGALVALHRIRRASHLSLMMGVAPDGGYGAAVLRG